MDISVPDFETYRNDRFLNEVSLKGGRLHLTWDDAQRAIVHFIWLRENCPCAKCHDPQVRERTILLTDIAADIAPFSVEISQAGDLEIVWQGDTQHTSVYHRGWLYENLLQSEEPIVSQTWDATCADSLPLIDGGSINNDRHPAFGEWIDAICRYGVGILTNTPPVPETVERLAGMIGVVRGSNFGNFFDVVTRQDADSMAYKSGELKPHTDLATREYQPGLQFLHCIKNDAKGGESVLVDGFRIAEIIRDNHPQEYETLTRVPLDFKNIAKTSDYRWSTPVICLGRDGTFDEIRMTYWLRAPQKASPQMHDRIYKALRLFMELADSSDNKIIYKLKPGDLLAFDNRRFLHGRLSFEMQSGERWLRGCYGEREELLSRQRIIKRQLKQR